MELKSKYTQTELLSEIVELAEDISDCSDVDICATHKKQWELVKTYWLDNFGSFNPEEHKCPLGAKWFDIAFAKTLNSSLRALDDGGAVDEKEYLKAAKSISASALDAYKLLVDIREFVLSGQIISTPEEDTTGTEYTMPKHYYGT